MQNKPNLREAKMSVNKVLTREYENSPLRKCAENKPNQTQSHRFYLPKGGTASGLVVDHINHNTLDNRRKNLRLCTWAQNNQNRRPSKRKNKLSKYKGVSFYKKSKLYRALIWCNKKQYFLGYFKDETDAAKAYDKKARELFGEFAYLNF